MKTNQKLREKQKRLDGGTFWLMKSEPDVFSLDDLRKNKTTFWEGVRNYQARNFMTQEMQIGDGVLFYHSNASPSGIAGLAEVSALAVPDPTQFDAKSEYYDPKSTREKPIWYCVEVRFLEKFKNFVSLEEIKKNEALKDILVIKKGQRLSIQPITKFHYDIIVRMGRE